MTFFASVWPRQNAAALGIPFLLYLLGGASVPLAAAWGGTVRDAWRLARGISAVALMLALVWGLDAVTHAVLLRQVPRVGALSSLDAISFRFDLVEALMLLLVAFLGWVIVTYSREYMAGDPRERGYIGHLMRTLAAVSLLVVTNSLIVFVAAWILTSLSLHGLLTLYPDRQAGMIAAHKKFLASRFGDATLICGVALLGLQTGSFRIDQVSARAGALAAGPGWIHVAAVLLAISAMIKCAQMPLHGWLIQVMEAPTPVSALLHAGVVNLGGFMLIRLSGVLNTTPAAKLLLVAGGCLTAVVASLVMTTRISIKVNLAWSTCAQMGFMLMECGLGLYGLAFLHLLAHSLYKAHAFLGSGGAVRQAQLKSMTPKRARVGAGMVVIACVGGILTAAAGALLWHPAALTDAAIFFCIPIAGFAIAGLMGGLVFERGFVASVLLCSSAVGVSVLYFAYEGLFQRMVPEVAAGPTQRALLLLPLISFLALFWIQAAVRVRPMGGIATRLYPWFYAGFYLDELFTRATFRLWPAKPVARQTAQRDAALLLERGRASL